MNYYNEFAPFAAQWLRNLILQGHLPRGDVDERSITEVKPDDLRGYTQCHFFAGIGGWSQALKLAGWESDRPVWTGSCPCQPFSSAGKQKGKADDRHLWPVWFRLIRECKPPVIFGEQVASAIAFGWLDEAAHDLESEGYAIGSAVLPACSVGAPHKRDRLWFVGYSQHDGRNGRQVTGSNAAAVCNHTQGQNSTGKSSGTGEPFDVANTKHEGLEGFAGNDCGTERWEEQGRPAPTQGFWSNAVFIQCPDGKARPVEPTIPLLADGIPNRVGKLRGYGNAIVPQVAAEFIAAMKQPTEGKI